MEDPIAIGDEMRVYVFQYVCCKPNQFHMPHRTQEERRRKGQIGKVFPSALSATGLEASVERHTPELPGGSQPHKRGSFIKACVCSTCTTSTETYLHIRPAAKRSGKRSLTPPPPGALPPHRRCCTCLISSALRTQESAPRLEQQLLVAYFASRAPQPQAEASQMLQAITQPSTTGRNVDRCPC